MLILSRKPGDAIIIGGNIRVVVLANDGGGVRLGIDAPASVAIVREEILKDITDQNVRAGATRENMPFIDGLDPGKKGGSRPARGTSKAAGPGDDRPRAEESDGVTPDAPETGSAGAESD